MKVQQILSCFFLLVQLSSGHLVKLNITNLEVVRKFSIIPGTKWCGIGDIAESREDLGLHHATDHCCREHDLCGEKIFPRESKFGLTSQELYTISSCACDTAFRKCLKKANTAISRLVGHTYFNTLNIKCLRLDRKVQECLKWDAYLGLFYPRCVLYQFDAYAPKRYQFFTQELW